MKFSSLLVAVVSTLVIISCSSKGASKANTTPEKNSSDSIQLEAITSPLYPIAAIDSLRYCIANDSIGVGSYDLVNYFTNNTAELGTDAFTAKHDGVTYRFKSAEHLEAFQESPEKYLPAFGGWCSMTLAMGRATTPTYDNFLIIDGKLHLFERTLSVNGRSLWQVDPTTNKKRASESYADYIDDGVIETSED